MYLHLFVPSNDLPHHLVLCGSVVEHRNANFEVVRISIPLWEIFVSLSNANDKTKEYLFISNTSL